MIGKKKKKLTDYIVHKVLDVYRVISRVLLILYTATHDMLFENWRDINKPGSPSFCIMYLALEAALHRSLLLRILCVYIPSYRGSISQSRLLFFFFFSLRGYGSSRVCELGPRIGALICDVKDDD